MIGDKIVDKITNHSKKSSKELRNNETEADIEKVATTKKIYILPKERQQIIDELRLV